MKLPLILFCLILFVIIFGIYYSPIFKIKTINFSGEEPNCISKDEIIKVSGTLGENLLFIDNNKIEKKIKDKYFCIRFAHLNKSIPDRLKLDLKNRRAALTLLPSVPDDSTESAKPKQIGQGLLIDDEGVIFSLDEGQSNQPAIFILGTDLEVGKSLDSEIVRRSIQVLDKLQNLGVNVDEPKITSQNYLYIDKKPQMIFILNDKINRQVASLQLILDQAKMDTKEVEFLDLRFDKPVIRYAPKKN